MKKNNKKGFTIVELVIVIAVIGILAGVLIPTFSSVVKKARLSADQQAVTQMNTELAIVEDEIGNFADAKSALLEANIDASNYKPLTKDHQFYYVKELKRIVLVSGEHKVVYPENLITKAQAEYDLGAAVSLSGEGNAEARDVVKGGALEAGAVINMMGASVNMKPVGDFTLGSSDASKPAAIVDAVSDEGTLLNANSTVKNEFSDNAYNAGMIANVPAGKTVTVKNLVIDGAVIGDAARPASAYAGIIAGSVDGTLIIENVTIKNSIVFGEYRVGALVGYVKTGATVIVKDVTIENTEVRGCTITAALFGQVMAATIQFSGVNNFSGVTVVYSDFNNWENYNYAEVEAKNGGEYIKGYPGKTDKYFWYAPSGTAWDAYIAKNEL